MKIHELFADPTNWTQGAACRYKSTAAKGPVLSILVGFEDKPEVKYSDPSTCCYCLLGAMYYCYPSEDGIQLVIDIVEEALSEYPDERNGIVLFNDNSTYSEVYALVKELDV